MYVFVCLRVCVCVCVATMTTTTLTNPWNSMETISISRSLPSVSATTCGNRRRRNNDLKGYSKHGHGGEDCDRRMTSSCRNLVSSRVVEGKTMIVRRKSSLSSSSSYTTTTTLTTVIIMTIVLASAHAFSTKPLSTATTKHNQHRGRTIATPISHHNKLIISSRLTSSTGPIIAAAGSSSTSLHMFGTMFSPAPKGLTTVVAGGEPQTLLDASEFFVDAFWTNKVGGGAKELSPQQRRTLRGSQFNEFRQRYAGLRRGQSELILMQAKRRPEEKSSSSSLSSSSSSSSSSSKATTNLVNFIGGGNTATNNNDYEIVGCAGIQVSPIPDGSLNGPTITQAPLMANVAVSRKYRRKGIAQKIVKEVEQVCRYQWGYNDVYLYVEERNKAAVKLYQKMGYRRVWTDTDAQTLLPTSNGKLENASTRIICMKKRLDLGLLGRILPF